MTSKKFFRKQCDFGCAVSLLSETDADVSFADTNGHWATEQIADCYAAGYIKGYGTKNGISLILNDIPFSNPI